MGRIEWFWNMIFYFMFQFDLKCSKLLNYINPFFLLNKTSVTKNIYKKKGISDMNMTANHFISNPKSGISSIWVGSFMGGLLVFIGIGFLNVFETIIGRSLVRDVSNGNFILFLIILLLPAIIINNYLLFRDDKYLRYFKEFDSLSKQKANHYKLITILVIVSVFTFLIGGFLLF